MCDSQSVPASSILYRWNPPEFKQRRRRIDTLNLGVNPALRVSKPPKGGHVCEAASATPF